MVLRQRRQISPSAVIPFFRVTTLAVAILLSGFYFAPKAFAQEATDEILQDVATEPSGEMPQKIIPAEIEQLTNLENEAPSEALEQSAGEQEFDDTLAYYSNQDYEDLVLAVFVDREAISSGIFAIQRNNRYYLPIGILSDLLTFKIDVDFDRRMATGWAITEDRNFVIDGLNNTVQYQTRSSALPEEAVLDESLANDDLYVQVEVLNQIWPLKFEVDLQGLILRVVPDEDLPFQKYRERQIRQKNLEARKEKQANEVEENLPFIAMPYKLFGMPAIDVQTEAGYDARRDNPVYKLGVNGVQDLGFASADYGATFTRIGGELDKPENIRLRFTRENAYDGALPLGLERVQWGDVNVRSRDLIVGGRSGTGLSFTNKKRRVDNDFDQITIDGIGVPGWEIELYRNDQLIEFGVVDDTGEYRFEDVEISYGNNQLRVVFYGPQGQIRERVENYFYQASMLRPGENELTGGVVDAGDDLITIDERENANEAKGLAASFYGARGISRNLTMFASTHTLKDNDVGVDDVRRSYATVGAIGSFDTTIAQAEIYKNFGQGHALDFRTLSDFKGFRVNTRSTFYSNFESPKAGRGSFAKEFEFEGKVKRTFATFLGNLGLDLGIEYLTRKNGAKNTTYTSRQSIAKAGTRFTHQTRTSLANGDHSSTTGRLDSTSRHKRWRLRNSLSYNYYPDTEFTSFQTELRRGTARDSSVALRLGRNFISDETTAGVQLTHDFKKFLGSIDTDWSSIHGASFMVRASASFGPYNSDGSYLMQSDPLRSAGPISSFVYLDKDYDGVFSEGDEPLPDTRIAIGKTVNRDETDENGYLTITNGRKDAITNVKVDQKSIDDPYVVNAIPGYSIYPRPGVIHSLQFPVIETGAIDGTIRWVSGRPVAGLAIQLMNADADIVQTSKTASDGYYTFERIPPGHYTIRADPETGYNIPFKYVDLTPENLFQFGMDIEASNLEAVAESDLGMGVDTDGNMLVKNIMSIAKSFKESGSILKRAEASAPQVVKTSTNTTNKPMTDSSSVVEAIRIGNHPGKVRVVLDLSGPVNYTLSHDPNSNSVFVEMPYATWAATPDWQSESRKILNNYRTETINGSGVLLTLGVEDDIEIGASGLLNASGGKKDRLYIDIEQK